MKMRKKEKDQGKQYLYMGFTVGQYFKFHLRCLVANTYFLFL